MLCLIENCLYYVIKLNDIIARLLNYQTSEAQIMSLNPPLAFVHIYLFILHLFTYLTLFLMKDSKSFIMKYFFAVRFEKLSPSIVSHFHKSIKLILDFVLHVFDYFESDKS